jgi:hypothetical protein
MVGRIRDEHERPTDFAESSPLDVTEAIPFR